MPDRKLTIPQPALIASKTRSAGLSGISALLGIGVIESDGTPARNQMIAQGYADLAGDSAPAKFVLDYYADQAKEHPWMGDHLLVLTDYLKGCSPEQVEGLVRAAKYLSTVALSEAESAAGADLLGRVHTEMIAQINKRRAPGHSFNLYEGMEDMLYSDLLPRDGARVTDLWAASGMRLIGAATWLRSEGGDPQTCTWVFMEGDAILRAIIAINCVAFELGDNVTILDGTEYKRTLIAAAMSGKTLVDENGYRVETERIAHKIAESISAVMEGGSGHL